MKFTLSKSQQKELLDRGHPLLIALPMQRDCESDEAALQLANEWLVLPAGCAIQSARVDEIEVSANLGVGPRQFLTDYLGMILLDGHDRARQPIVTRHVVVLATIAGPANRHGTRAPQWPGGVIKA